MGIHVHFIPQPNHTQNHGLKQLLTIYSMLLGYVLINKYLNNGLNNYNHPNMSIMCMILHGHKHELELPQ